MKLSVQNQRVNTEGIRFSAVKYVNITETMRNPKHQKKPILITVVSSLGFASRSITQNPKSMPEAVKIPTKYSGSTAKSIGNPKNPRTMSEIEIKPNAIDFRYKNRIFFHDISSSLFRMKDKY